MSNKQVIARYGSEIIHISNYQRSVHWGKIHCPFCDPPLRVNYNVNGYFKAWPDEGGHNCRKIVTQYFDADWEGRNYVEIIESEKGSLHVTIDMESLTKLHSKVQNSRHQLVKPEDSYPKYSKYESKKKVFRDVIRSIYQMKRLIENNNLSSLEKIQFIFKVGSEKPLSIHELVVLGNNIQFGPNYKYRFCVFKVERMIQKDDIAYYNGYIMDGCQLVATLKYSYSSSKLKKLENEYVIAYGLMKRAKDNSNKIFLELTHDFHIQSIKDSSVDQLFENSTIESYSFKASLKKQLQLDASENATYKGESNKDHEVKRKQNLMSYNNQTFSIKPEEKERLVSQPTVQLTPEPNIKCALPPIHDKTVSNEIPLEPKKGKKKGIIKKFIDKLLGSG